MDFKINNRYKELLIKFAGSDELMELLDLAILEQRRREIMHYSKSKEYPEKQDCLDLLITDLLTTKTALVTSVNNNIKF